MIYTTPKGTQVHIDSSRELARGGEGAVFMLQNPPDMVAKIYHDASRHRLAEKLSQLQTLDANLFVKPLDTLHDASGNLTGYLMEYLDKRYAPLSAFFSLAFCQRIGLSDADRLGIAELLCRVVSHAHAQQIVIGDLNPLNIMVHQRTKALRLIDTDAYQTVQVPHSLTLLDDIRDYYYSGQVSEQSDYYALAVLVFQLLTYVHPYKGVHAHYPTLEQRIMNRCPVFVNDPLLTRPKCYKPLALPHLNTQFEAIFIRQQRFLLQMSQVSASALYAASAPVAVQPLSLGSNSLKATVWWQSDGSDSIEQVYSTATRILVKTRKFYRLYECPQQGSVFLLNEWPINTADMILAGAQQVLALRAQQLFYLNPDGQWLPVKNFTVQAGAHVVQYGNMWVILEEHSLKWLLPDTLNQGFVQMGQTPAYAARFSTYPSMWQYVGGKHFVFYNTGKQLNTMHVNLHLVAVRMLGSAALIAHKKTENGQVKLVYEYACVPKGGYGFATSGMQTGSDVVFALQENQSQTLVFEPADGAILVRRLPDFQVLQQIDYPEMSSETQLYYTSAGLIAVNTQAGVLLNRKA